MATPAQNHAPEAHRLGAGSAPQAGPGEPVPVAFLGRTSTLEMQDPRASLSRQIRAARAWLPPGWFITAWYWDIESGGLDLEARGRGAGLARRGRGHPPRRRHGRPARRGRQPRPEVRRGGLRGHRAVRPGHLQRAETGEEAVPDRDPAVRHRRARRHRRRQRHHGAGPADEARRGGMVPAAAEGENLERPGRARPGRVEHRPRPLRLPRRPDPAPGPGQSLPGPHQDPAGPGPGPRPGRRADLHLAGRATSSACPTIAARLNADPARYPAPTGKGWTTQTVYAILGNPKYTGHMVYGRIRTRNGRRVTVPQSEWLWSPEPVHPAIVDRDTWAAAQDDRRGAFAPAGTATG